MTPVALAFVGDQPGAVAAPIVSRPLRDLPAVLLFSERSRPTAERIRDWCALHFPDRASIDLAGPLDSGAGFETAVDVAKRTGAANVLVNGGRTDWLLRLIDELSGALREDRIELWQSRDIHGERISMSGATHHWTVDDVDESRDQPLRLLDLLGLRFDPARGLLERPAGPSLPGCLQVGERAGQLLVAVSPAAWPDSADSGRALRQYRKLLAHRHLQSLGLERHRVFLSDPERLRGRALQDGIPVESAGFGAVEWLRAREAGPEGASEQRLPDKPFRKDCEDGWSGTLVTTLGSAPAATLTALWAHKPAIAVLLCDSTSPDVSHAAWKLAKRAPCRLHFVPWRRDHESLWRGLAPWERSDVVVNATPGDKLATVLLFLWARSDRRLRPVWLLEGATAVPATGATGATETAHIPLVRWLDVHAPGDVTPTAHWLAPATSEIGDLHCRYAEPLLGYLARVTSHQPLESLRDRQHPPRVERDDLVLAAGAVQDIRTFPASLQTTLRQTRSGDGAPGAWLEWAVALRLASLGADEVVLGTRMSWRRGKIEQGVHRDELDVVTRHGGQTTLWSCKTTPLPGEEFIQAHSLEARAQADRLLGRSSQAVLVVSRLRDKTSTTGYAELGDGEHVVDARFLLGGDPLELASRRRGNR